MKKEGRNERDAGVALILLRLFPGVQSYKRGLPLSFPIVLSSPGERHLTDVATARDSSRAASGEHLDTRIKVKVKGVSSVMLLCLLQSS